MSVKKEEEWLRKFYEGTFLIKGWHARMEELLQVVPSENKEDIRASLAELGERIGGEWSKGNEIRRIDNAVLQQWGDSLRTAKKKGLEALADKIREIGAEVDGILS